MGIKGSPGIRLYLQVLLLLLSCVAAAQNIGLSLPLSPLSPKQMQECDELQSQWDSLRKQVEAAHQKCLDAHSTEPAVPNSGGSTPGSICNHSECQGLHKILFSEIEPKSQATVQECRNEVNQYQQQQAQQQVATQAAVQLAQQQLQQRVDYYRNRAQQLADQSRAKQQTVAQQIRQAEAMQQSAYQQTEAQLKAAAQDSVEKLEAQNGSPPTVIPTDTALAGTTQDDDVSSASANGQGGGVTVLDYNHPDTLPTNSPGVTVLDFNDPSSLPKSSPGVSVLDFGPSQTTSNESQDANSNDETAQAVGQEGASNQATPDRANIRANDSSDVEKTSELPSADSSTAAAGNNFGENHTFPSEQASEKLEAVHTVDEAVVDQALRQAESQLKSAKDLPDTPKNAALVQNCEDAVAEAEGLKTLLTNFKYGIDAANMAGDIASGKGAGDAFATLTGDAAQTAINEFVQGIVKDTVLEGPAGIVLPLFDATPTSTYADLNTVIGNSSVSFEGQAKALHWLYSVQFDQTQAANNNQVITASAQSFMMQQTSNFMNSTQLTLDQKREAFGYLLREYYGHQTLWSPQQVQQLRQYFFALY